MKLTHFVLTALLAALGGTIHAAGPEAPLDVHLTLPVAGEWRCPPGQDCTRQPDYLAYVVRSPQASIYLSLAGGLAWPLDEAGLQRAFRYVDIYLPEGEPDTWSAFNVSKDSPARGTAKLSLPARDSLQLELRTTDYRQRQRRVGPDVHCPGSDVRGYCITEQRVDRPATLLIRIPLAVSAHAPWARPANQDK